MSYDVTSPQGVSINFDATDGSDFLYFQPPQINSNRAIDIVSGPFNGYGEDGTIAVFPTQRYVCDPQVDTTRERRAIAIAAMPFRGTSGATRQDLEPAYIGLFLDHNQGQYYPNQPQRPPYPHKPIEARFDNPGGPVDLIGRNMYVIECRAVSACVVPSRPGGDNSGTLYVAAVARYADNKNYTTEDPITGTFVWDKLQVWRVNLDSAVFPDEGQLGGYGAAIGHSDFLYYFDPDHTDSQYYRPEILDVALSASNTAEKSGLYVSWIEARPGTLPGASDATRDTRLLIDYIPLTVNTGTQPPTFEQFERLGLVWPNGAEDKSATNWQDDSFSFDGTGLAGDHLHDAFDEFRHLGGTYVNSLESDFDFAHSADGDPRLIYYDFEEGPNHTTIGPRQALIQLDPETREPIEPVDEFDSNLWLAEEKCSGAEETLYTETTTQLFGALAVNQANPFNLNRAFAHYALKVGPAGGALSYDVWTQPLQTPSGNDDWLTPSAGRTLTRPSAPAGELLRFPDLTYRFDGSLREIAGEDLDEDGNGTVSTNREVIYDADASPLSTSLFPHIATNGANLTDNFVVYVTGASGSQQLTIVQVDP